MAKIFTSDLTKYENLEKEFWRKNYQQASKMTNNIIERRKTSTKLLKVCINQYKDLFKKSKTILEVGAGSGWASCFIKKKFPNKKIIASDISGYAMKLINGWQGYYKVKIDKKIVCPSHIIPLKDCSVDLIFLNNSAHHLARLDASFNEFARILKPSGSVLFFHEPSCNTLLYYPALVRVNIRRYGVHEDLLRPRLVKGIANKNGFKMQLRAFLCPEGRGKFESKYYALLRKLPWLTPTLPGCFNYKFTRIKK